jgi:signal transduction histidine kinase
VVELQFFDALRIGAWRGSPALIGNAAAERLVGSRSAAAVERLLHVHFEQGLPLETTEGPAEIRRSEEGWVCVPMKAPSAPAVAFELGRSGSGWVIHESSTPEFIGAPLELVSADFARALVERSRFEQGTWTSCVGVSWKWWHLGPARLMAVAERAISGDVKAWQFQRAATEWVAALDGVEDGVALVADGQVLRCNRAFAELAGIDIWTFQPTPLSSVVRAITGRPDEPALSDESLLVSRTGRTLRARLMPSRLPFTSVLSLRDVTEGVRADRLASAIAQLQTSGVLLAGIRHELRNPLMAWTTGLEALRRVLPAPLDGRVQRVLSSLDLALGRIEFVLEGLRPIQENEALAAESVELSQFVENFARVARSEASTRGVTFDVQLAPVRVVGDRRALHHVLRNLFVNALEATEQAALTRSVTIVVRPHERGGVLEVIDTGPGIAPAVAERLFRPFETSKPNGTGLGLYVTSRLVKRMGGTIEATLRQGHTAFVVELPGAAS